MNKKKLLDSLKFLKLNLETLANLLNVSLPTVHRWANNSDKIPGPTKEVIRAWVRLEQYNLPWGNLIKIGNETKVHEIIENFTKSHRDKIIKTVTKRGADKKINWKINYNKNTIETKYVRIYFDTNNMATQYSLLDYFPGIDIDFLIEEAVYFLNNLDKD
jgi:transcriptional regulator with XRE-family HTH domain